jgi:hypothetical protein
MHIGWERFLKSAGHGGAVAGPAVLEYARMYRQEAGIAELVETASGMGIRSPFFPGSGSG